MLHKKLSVAINHSEERKAGNISILPSIPDDVGATKHCCHLLVFCPPSIVSCCHGSQMMMMAQV